MLRPTLPGTRASETWGVSLDGRLACGGTSDIPMAQGDGEHLTHAKGAIWTDGDILTIEPAAFGAEAQAVLFTGMTDNGNFCYGSINTTRSNSKGGLYAITSGQTWIFDGGDINGDGQINILDDHDSAVYALSEDARIVGGSITLPGGPETAAFWALDGSTYIEHDLMGYLDSLGVSGLGGWQLGAVTGVSADGSVLVGWGSNPLGQTTGWSLSIPAPGSLALLGLGGLVTGRRRRL
ncbi:MAG: PEP-CTERM sorting domain-containing protein [Phycisphaerales bacterium]|nr:PEP-CTERM sorting domain-containing protein [Phycisphaerales bacterium]